MACCDVLGDRASRFRRSTRGSANAHVAMAAMRSTTSTSQIDRSFDDDDDDDDAELVDVGTDVCGVPPGVLAIVVVGPAGCVTGVVVGVVIGVAELGSSAFACCGMTPVRSSAPG